jgi:hypothetical protein
MLSHVRYVAYSGQFYRTIRHAWQGIYGMPQATTLGRGMGSGRAWSPWGMENSLKKTRHSFRYFWPSCLQSRSIPDTV